MAKPTVFDALNEALGTTAGTGEVETHEDEGTGDATDEGGEESLEGDSEAGDGDDAGEEGDSEVEGDEGSADDESDGAGDPAAGEGERNPDGTFKKKAGDKPGEKPDEAKKPDAINDPVPKDLKPETKQRMETLVKTAKELTVERDKVVGDFNLFVGGLQNAGVTPEQYGETLSFLALFNSGDPVQQGQALELIEGMADRLATLLGKERSVSDPLKGHADLQQAVAQNKVTKEYAAEIARTRNANGFRQQLTTTANEQQRQQQAQQQELHQARTDLTALEDTLAATDPLYERKKAIIVPALKPLMDSIPPSKWKEKFLAAYNNVKLGAPARRPAPRPGQQPLRAGKNPAGGRANTVASPLDALNGALSSMK